MAILNDGVTRPADLYKALEQISPMLSAEDHLNDHAHRAHETMHQLHDALSDMVDIEWENLLDKASPESLHVINPTDYWQDGIAVFHEGALPWCSVRHLFVLGFSDGLFPAGAGSSAVFTEAEWEHIDAAGWLVVTNDFIRKPITPSGSHMFRRNGH